MKKIFTLIALVMLSNMAQAAFEAGNVPSPKIAAPAGPRFPGSRIKLNAALPDYDFAEGKQRLGCLWSLAQKVDPIVEPNVFPSNHLHDFYGNPTINQFSTAASLALPTAGSSCSGGNEYQSSFWFPSIVDTNDVVTPASGSTPAKYRYVGTSGALVYYASAVGLEGRKVQPIPFGLKMVIGKMHNTNPAENLSDWSCSNATGTPFTRVGAQKTIPTCVYGEKLRELLRFNQCLKLKPNGQPYLDTDAVNFPANDHRSHLVPTRTGNWQTNPAQNECPSGHMLIPQVTLIRDTVVPAGKTTAGYRLVTDNSNMSNPGGTAHADYFMAMKAKWMNMIVENCINDHKNCGIGLMGIDPADGISKALIQ
jgi:hypothetical protein